MRLENTDRDIDFLLSGGIDSSIIVLIVSCNKSRRKHRSKGGVTCGELS